MKILITESQYKKLISEQPMGVGIYSDAEVAGYENIIPTFKKIKKDYPNTFDTVVQLGLWFIPYVGPYLSAAYGTANAIKKIKSGDKVSGIIELITSPLGLNKTITFLKIVGQTGDFLSMLEKINKSGLPVLISKGQESFLKWGANTIGKDFETFIKLLNDQKLMKLLLKEINVLN